MAEAGGAPDEDAEEDDAEEDDAEEDDAPDDDGPDNDDPDEEGGDDDNGGGDDGRGDVEEREGAGGAVRAAQSANGDASVPPVEPVVASPVHAADAATSRTAGSRAGSAARCRAGEGRPPA